MELSYIIPLFFGGILFRRVGPQAILLGFFLAASVSLFVSFSKEWFGMEKAISWMWGIPFSFTLGMIVAGLGGFFFRSPSPDRIQGLTYGDRRAP